MIHTMKQSMVVTNLRMPRSDYLQVKAMAGELGMSINEYINAITKDTARTRMMKRDAPSPRHKETILEAFDRIAKISGKPMGWSKEDEEIYSI
mgnify:CR=1 FL=1